MKQPQAAVVLQGVALQLLEAATLHGDNIWRNGCPFLQIQQEDRFAELDSFTEKASNRQ